MSRYLIIPVGLALAALGWLWLSGGFDQLALWAASEQRGFQNQMARALRALRGGEPQALMVLLSVCFAYGFFHAVGPGHGKILIGGYGLGRRVPLLRLTAISVLSSLGQAVTAVVLVYTGVLILQMSRERLVGVTESVMAPASYGAIVLIGGWLIIRALRKIYRLSGQPAAAGAHAQTCPDCGHRHGPDPSEVEQVGSLREAAVLIGGIAMRPCSGALFLLVVTWQMGIAAAGIAGAFAMALGTATITTGVGWMSVALRGGLLASLSGGRFAGVLAPVIELTAGLLIAVVAAGLLMRAL